MSLFDKHLSYTKRDYLTLLVRQPPFVLTNLRPHGLERRRRVGLYLLLYDFLMIRIDAWSVCVSCALLLSA